MPSDYTGSPSGIKPHDIPVITCPVDKDPRNAASVNTPLEKLADYTAFLQANTIAPTDPAIQLTGSGAQSITKTTPGGLSIGTGPGNGDLSLVANGIELLKLLAGGAIDACNKVLQNLGAPTNSNDAMRYGDSFAAPTIIRPPIDSKYTNGGGDYDFGYWKDRNGVVHFLGMITNASDRSNVTIFVVLPPGFRPKSSRIFMVPSNNNEHGNLCMEPDGQVWLMGAFVGLGIPINQPTYLDSVSFLAEQ